MVRLRVGRTDSGSYNSLCLGEPLPVSEPQERDQNLGNIEMH